MPKSKRSVKNACRRELGLKKRAEELRLLLEATEEGSPLLFKLSEDPGETTDFSAKFPEKVEELGTKAAAAMKELDPSEKFGIVTPE